MIVSITRQHSFRIGHHGEVDVTLRQLRALREVSVRGSVAAAAGSLGYTPSAVSQQLAALERSAGVQLLERVGRGVELTGAGEQLARDAEAVLVRMEEAETALASGDDRPRGRVRLATFESFAVTLLPDVLRRLRAEAAELRVHTYQADPDDAIERVASGGSDVAVVVATPQAPGPRPVSVARSVLGADPYLLVVPVGDPLHGVVELGAVADRPFVTGFADSWCARSVLGACRAAGFEPDVRHEIDATRAAVRMVAAGVGVALLPRLALDDLPDGVRTVELAEPVRRSVEVVHRRSIGGRPGVRALMAAIVEAASGVLDPCPLGEG
jgi:DNA-binding transcriptional LysR family regulator